MKKVSLGFPFGAPQFPAARVTTAVRQHRSQAQLTYSHNLKKTQKSQERINIKDMFQNSLSNGTNYFSLTHFYFLLETFAICRLGLRKISISRSEDAPLFWEHLEKPAVECSAASVHSRLAWGCMNHWFEVTLASIMF